MELPRLIVPVVLGVACLAGCGEMKPRPAADTKAIPPVVEKDLAKHSIRQDKDFRSASTLGKARDVAVRGVDNAEEYQKKVAQQADEVFKTK